MQNQNLRLRRSLERRQVGRLRGSKTGLSECSQSTADMRQRERIAVELILTSRVQHRAVCCHLKLLVNAVNAEVGFVQECGSSVADNADTSSVLSSSGFVYSI